MSLRFLCQHDYFSRPAPTIHRLKKAKTMYGRTYIARVYINAGLLYIRTSIIEYLRLPINVYNYVYVLLNVNAVK
jgi:hypothetical protein